jgi:hypothetical protein
LHHYGEKRKHFSSKSFQSHCIAPLQREKKTFFIKIFPVTSHYTTTERSRQESVQQRGGGGGDRNSQIKKFLKNTLFGRMIGWMTGRMTVRADSGVASFLIPKTVQKLNPPLL